MLKTIAHPLIGFLLIFSILAPSVIQLVDNDSPIAILMDSSEEEKNNDQESEKKMGEKDMYLNPCSLAQNIIDQNSRAEVLEQSFILLDATSEIFLPPPEQMV
ncbi:hypothetical protein M3P19_08820 [Muricauda sp. 2012CJ35-5]|uniref:Uncharacterized protein n=1 Tax=Flagellimonas spongiicola TaxID=2942208 RepID=A0ABT0PS60_9FLAO|nr:hypothetical protein [Allomuricauda spongiicola]MCL6274111.1 hypothetical protein [Allomuricauda spongiicola]